MKKILFTILLFGLTTEIVLSQAFEARIINNNNGYLEYQLRETTGFNPPSQLTPITDITYIIRWSIALGDPLEINKICEVFTTSNSYNIIEGFPNALNQGGYYYKLFGAEPTPVYPPAEIDTWPQNEWQLITVMKITNPTSGTGDFEVAPVGFIATDINFSYDSDEDGTPEDYIPTIVGSVTAYPFPTFIFDRIWTGVATSRWNLPSNWVDMCGETTTLPTVSTNVLIPDVDDENENAFNPDTATADLATLSLTIGSGGYLRVPRTRRLNATGATIVQPDGQLIIKTTTPALPTQFNTLELKPSTLRAAGVMTIYPGAKVSASGTTTLSSTGQLVILSNTTASGSFIDNGTVVHGSSGSASVQTYIKNSAAAGDYYAHLVGPTVNDPAFQTATGNNGVYLSAFNLDVLGTYAYKYTEPDNSWTNIYSNIEQIRTGKGIMISTVDAADNTLTMTGELVYGTITSAPLQFGGVNNLDLLSNPYPSTLSFNLFFAANSGFILNKYQVYNPATGTYVFYQIGGGGTLTTNIPVGQGFFVETTGVGPVTFANNQRVHSTAFIMKDIYPYQLRLNLAGNGYADATFINFNESGSYSYDATNDTYKWMSILPEASEFWTVANDQSFLCMNTLPTLGGSMISVPLSFECNAEGIHTITAENISSFDQGTEIFLEDIVSGTEWHNLVQNPVYEFTGSPSDDQNRFIVHFFGPTGINDPDGSGLIDIYAWGQDAYIVNRGIETVKEYVVYDLMGREMHRGTLPNNTVNKVTIGDVSAYYIVKVITKEGRIYNDKVYITK